MLPHKAYVGLPVVIGLVAIMFFWLCRRPFVTRPYSYIHEKVSVGEWIVVQGAPFMINAAPVVSRFEDHSEPTWPAIHLGLGNGQDVSGRPTDEVRLVKARVLFDRWRDPIPFNPIEVLASREIYDLLVDVVDAFESPDPWQPIGDTSDAVLSVAESLGMIRRGRRRHRHQVSCTPAGRVWLLQEARARGRELVPNSKPPKPAGTTNWVVNAENSNVNIVVGDLLGKIENNLNRLESQVIDAVEVGKGLRALAEGTAADGGLTPTQQQELLESIEYLTQAASDEEQVRHPHALRLSIRAIGATVGASAALTTLWDVWERPIAQFFGVG